MKPEGSKSNLRSGLPTFKFVCPKMKWVNDESPPQNSQTMLLWKSLYHTIWIKVNINPFFIYHIFSHNQHLIKSFIFSLLNTSFSNYLYISNILHNLLYIHPHYNAYSINIIIHYLPRNHTFLSIPSLEYKVLFSVD